ncbi:MAG: cupin domain-containing protein [Balneolaceae bacterium]
MHGKRIQELISSLNLMAHPEGGYFKETYRSEGIIPQKCLDQPIQGDRNYSTGIYFLLTSDTFSAFHRINQDEMWHFYEGSSLTIHMIDSDGVYSSQKIGLNFSDGEVPQFTVPKRVWFAAEVNDPDSFAFVGCTVSPGFDFADFELANQKILTGKFPEQKEIIERLTRV